MHLVYDKSVKLSIKAKKKYNCKIEDNYINIFKNNNIDIIFISTPTNTHIKFIEEGIKYKKIIFCEKPLDLNISKVIKTYIKVKKNNSKIQLGFNRRYDPGHFSLKKELQSGKIFFLSFKILSLFVIIPYEALIKSVRSIL